MTPPLDRPRRLFTPIDRAWLRMDRPTNLMTVNCVMVLAESIEPSRLRRMVEERLLAAERFRQVPVQEFGWFGRRHQWVEARDFDLDQHLRFSELPGPGGDAELQAFITEQMQRPLAKGRPLWRLHAVGNYRGRSVLFWQLQHCMGDGVALMVLLLSLTDLEKEPREPNPLRELFKGPELDADSALTQIEAVMPEAARLMAKPAEKVESTHPLVLWVAGIFSFLGLTLLPPDRRSPFKGRMGGVKRVAWSRGIPMAEIQELRSQLGGTVTDILLTAASGALRQYWQGRGGVPRDLRALIPVSLRPVDEMRDLGNRFGIVFLRLPLESEDPSERLGKLRRRMRRLKWSLQPLVTMVALAVLGVSPLRLQRLVLRIFGLKGSMVMSSVPGPCQALFLDGHTIEDFFFWVPQSAGLNLGLSILTYAGRARVGLMTDAAVIDDPQWIIDAFEREFLRMGSDQSSSPE